MAIIDLVKYNGGPDVFAWKYPNEALSTWTQLIVNESQQAVLYKGGKALDVFEPGRHTLSTENIPLLREFIKLPFGGRSPFTAEIWFINKAYTLDIKWGTPTPIQIQDPKYGIFVPVSANGAFGIHISDSKAFLTKLVGTQTRFDRVSISKYFRGLYITKVKDTLSSYLIHKDVSVLELNAYIDEISCQLQEKITPIMADYGVSLSNFQVNNISVPEDDPAVIKLKAALAKRAEMNIIGYSYQQERSFDTLEGAANNTGAGASLMGVGMGLGMGAAMGRVVGAGFGTMIGEIDPYGSTQRAECPRCHSPLAVGQRFCGNCGTDVEAYKAKGASPTCSACGASIEKGMLFCMKCGRKLDICTNCGNDIPNGAKVCPSCGQKKPRICPKCGKTVSSESRFCPSCGHSFVKVCPKCGNPVSEGMGFCTKCGQSLM